MSVYTRTGDTGKTSLFAGKRVSKVNLRIEAIGTVDELNSAIGVALSGLKIKQSLRAKALKNSELRIELIRIQNDLFEIGAGLANPSAKVFKLDKRVKEFEKEIDKLDKKLPELQNFILPGGSLAGSQLHLARTVCRRAERRIVELSEKENIESSIIIYINRLSDLLFMIARFVNYKEKKKETIWEKKI